MESFINTNMDFFVRVLAALILGFILGFEREITNKCAGLRTNILVCLGACVFTIISIYGFPTVTSGDHPNGIRDTARVAAQVVTGIGFIGAGTVLRHGPTILGITTAATLWISASIGMACGTAHYDVAIFTTLLSVLVLTVIRIFERDVLTSSSKNVNYLKITLYCNNNYVQAIQDYITSEFPGIMEFSLKTLVENKAETKISFSIEINDKKPIDTLNNKLKKLEGIKSLSIRDLNEEFCK